MEQTRRVGLVGASMGPRQERVLSPEEFERLQQLLVEESGLCIGGDRQDRLARILAERMAKRHMSSVQEYDRSLRCKPAGKEELQALIEALTVGETFFFRNQPQFEALAQQVLPEFIRRRGAGHKRLVIWSAGCATGEEPYSLAITLLETLPDPSAWTLVILATDVNRGFLAKAREGIYGARSVQHVPKTWRSKYFTPHNGKYVLANEVKRLVQFAHHNLAKDPWVLPGMGEVDVLFCRNMLMYFSGAAMKRIVDRFADCLTEEGYLFLGHAETLWQISERFTAVELPHAVLYRKTQQPGLGQIKPVVCLPDSVAVMALETTAPNLEESQEPTDSSAAPEPLAASSSSHELGVRASRRKDYDQALAYFEEVLPADPRYFSARLGKASILANQGRYKQAIAVLSEVIRADTLSSEAYYLLGVLYHKTGHVEQAIEAFQRTLYVDPTTALASVALGNLYRYQRRAGNAKRAFQNALKVLDSKPEEELVRFSEDITCGYLRAVCARSLEQLT